MKDDFKTLAQSLDMLIGKLGFQNKLKEQQVLEEWPLIAGPQISKVARPERVTDRVLYLAVANMSWRTELTFQKKTLLQQIEKRVGKNIIIDMRFF